MSSRMRFKKEKPSEFSEGSIARIRLENFLTYDSVEFCPGTSLNVIIGPNGTGKSTIVCAICLGLAGKPNLLGRALQAMEYIKHGCTKAIIEIELYNSDGDNYVIKREIMKDNTSKWSVNGRNSLQKAVEELVQRLNIQVGNLCQFLPQDKVADFAKMTQQELLENTQKAVGPPEMFERHQRLKVARENDRELELSYSRAKQQVEQEQAANARLEQDVKNYKEKQRHMEKVNQLTMKRPWVEYEERRKEFQAAKDLKEAMATQVRAARAQNEPLQKRLEVAQKKIKEVESTMKKLGDSVKDCARRATDCNKCIENLGDQTQEIQDELGQKRQEERNRKQRLKNLTDQKKALEDELDGLNDEDTQPAIDKVTSDMSHLTREMTRVKHGAETTRMNHDSTKRDIAGSQTELRELQDLNNRRLNELRRRHKDTYDAVQWLRANKHLFKATIHEPMMLLINMKSTTMAKYVESHISFNDLRAFVYEDPDDMELFMKKIRTEQGLRVNMVEAPKQPSNTYKPQQPLDRIRHFGFGHYMRDLFDCPEGVMRYLCMRYHVHQIPVGNAHTKSCVEAIISQQPSLTNFYTANHSYSIKHSKYSKAMSSRCTELKKPGLLAMSFNSDREREVKQELQAKQAELKTLEVELRGLDQKYKDLEGQMNTLRNNKKELQNQKNQRRQIEQKINMKKDNISRLETEAVNMEQEEVLVRQKISSLLIQKCKKLKELQDHTKKCQKLSEDKVRQSLAYATCCQEQHSVDEELREQSFALRNLEREFEKKKEDVKVLKDEAMQLFSAAKKASKLGKDEELSAEIKKVFELLPSTVEKIDAAIHEEQARADCAYHTDENVVKEYHNREKAIRRLETDVQNRERSLQQHRADIEEAKAQWLAPLKELVSRINANFSNFFQRMKCAGEVDLNVPENPEDYEKYGIRIKVLFRDNEELRELTPHHQSGGERSVSTVLYMMALQELTRVPFRCVDEINQGMDPQNERKVFELVVQTACARSTSQYFLLTPKLLPDLQYTDNMTVLCIYNGPHMVNHTEWKLSKFIRRRARLEN